MIVAIHQPNFLPWLGYFHKLISSDLFVLFDDVQLPRGKSFANRVQIKTPQGPAWMTIPVADKGDLVRINEARIAEAGWKRKVLRTLEVNYSRAPYRKSYFPEFKEIIENANDGLCALNSALIRWCAKQLGGGTQLQYSSEMCKNAPAADGETKIQYVLEATGATTYLSGEGAGSRRYIKEDWFVQHGINLQWQNFQHPRYPQLHGEFLERLSIIDLIFNCGPESRRVLLAH